MLKFIEGDKLVEEFCGLRTSDAHADIAVAFWGKGAAAELKISKDGSPRIVCNLESGACDPDEIKSIKDSGLEIKTHPQLHAKAYLTEHGAIVGSANASTNGLAMSGGISAWREANVLTDDTATLRDIRAWFDRIWGEAREISDSDIENARRIWARRRRMAPAKHGEVSLFDAFVDDHALFECANCLVVFEDELSDEANNRLDRFNEERPGWDANFKFLWETTTRLEQDFALILCDFVDRQNPKIFGYARMPDPIIEIHVNRHYLYPAVSEDALKIGPMCFRLTDDEKSKLLNALKAYPRVKNASGWDVAVPLSELIKR